MRARRAGARVVWVAFSAVIVIIAGCEAIVSDNVPSFACSGNDGSCPVGMTCVPATGQCIATTSSCLVTHCVLPLECDSNSLECVNPDNIVDGSFIVHEASIPPQTDATSPGTDASPETDSGPQKPYPLGAKCSTGTDCASGLCATAADLDDTYFHAVGAVCIQPCCTSESCGTGFVCAGTATGGNYCLDATSIGLTVGAEKGGTSCTAPTDCRSGQCIGNVCADTCCTDTDCASGAHCRLTEVQAGHVNFACGTGGTKSVGQTCTTSDDCISGSCYGSGSTTCRPACCGQTSSVAENYGACTYLSSGSGDVLTGGLYPGQQAPGNGVVGSACTESTDCKSDLCDTTDGVCSDVCCVDSDCAAYAPFGYTKCRPVALSGLGGTISPLICVKAD